jgi:hypothetical protein
LQQGAFRFTQFEDIIRTYDVKLQRPKEQWWMGMRPLGRILAQPEAGYYRTRGELQDGDA